MTKIYDCYKSLRITKNISVKDLKCKGNGHIHNTIVNEEFLNKVQKFVDDNDFSKIEIITGYLCNDYIKRNNISNNKYSTNSAIDVILYKDDELISAKEICKLAKKSGLIATPLNENRVCLEDGDLIIKEEPKEEIIEEPEEQTTFNEDTIEELLEDGEVENVSN